MHVKNISKNNNCMQGDELKKIPSEEVLDEIKMEAVDSNRKEVLVSASLSMV